MKTAEETKELTDELQRRKRQADRRLREAQIDDMLAVPIDYMEEFKWKEQQDVDRIQAEKTLSSSDFDILADDEEEDLNLQPDNTIRLFSTVETTIEKERHLTIQPLVPVQLKEGKEGQEEPGLGLEEILHTTEDQELDDDNTDEDEQPVSPSNKKVAADFFLNTEAEVDEDEELEEQLDSNIGGLFVEDLEEVTSIRENDISAIDSNISSATASVESGVMELEKASASVNSMTKGLRTVFQGLSRGTEALKNMAASLQTAKPTKHKALALETGRKGKVAVREQVPVRQPTVVRGLQQSATPVSSSATATGKPVPPPAPVVRDRAPGGGQQQQQRSSFSVDTHLDSLSNISLGLRNTAKTEEKQYAAKKYSAGGETNMPSQPPERPSLLPAHSRVSKDGPSYGKESGRISARDGKDSHRADSTKMMQGELAYTKESNEVDGRFIGGLPAPEAGQRNERRRWKQEATVEEESTEEEGGRRGFFAALVDGVGRDVTVFPRKKRVAYKMNGVGTATSPSTGEHIPYAGYVTFQVAMRLTCTLNSEIRLQELLLLQAEKDFQPTNTTSPLGLSLVYVINSNLMITHPFV